MNDFIRIEANENFSFFFNRQNIAGVAIDKRKPTELHILMVGDEDPTPFKFNTVEERNDKLSEILADKGLCDRETTEPQVSEE